MNSASVETPAALECDEVTAEYTDRNGKRVKVKAKDLLAQAICHEYDHLEGEVFVDKIVPGTMEYVEPEK